MKGLDLIAPFHLYPNSFNRPLGSYATVVSCFHSEHLHILSLVFSAINREIDEEKCIYSSLLRHPDVDLQYPIHVHLNLRTSRG